eukprot:3188865-Rhodomonas_salina.1
MRLGGVSGYPGTGTRVRAPTIEARFFNGKQMPFGEFRAVPCALHGSCGLCAAALRSLVVRICEMLRAWEARARHVNAHTENSDESQELYQRTF